MAFHQWRNEKGLRRRSSSLIMSLVVTSSSFVRGVGRGFVKGKLVDKDSTEDIDFGAKLGVKVRAKK